MNDTQLLHSMNALLKSDVEGVLEYVEVNETHSDQEQISNNVVSLIAQEVQHTREHLNSSDFKHDLHAVLFRAWQQNIGSYRPYAKFYHRNGLTTKEYYALVCNFDLWSPLASTLYSLSPEHALDIINALRICYPDNKMTDDCFGIYLTICANLPQDKRYKQCDTVLVNSLSQGYKTAALVASISAALMNLLSVLIQDVKGTPPIKDYVSNIPNIILNVLNSVNTTLFYDTGMFTQQIHAIQQLFWMRLQSHLSSIDSRLLQVDQLCQEEVEKWRAIRSGSNEWILPIQTRTRRTNIQEFSPNEHVSNKHHAAFIRIFKQIDKNCPFNGATVDHLEEMINGSRNTRIHQHLVPGNTNNRHLEASVNRDENDVLRKYVQDCVNRIERRAAGWISFLELTVDYQDIVFSHLVFESPAFSSICSAIATENLHWKFFLRLSHIVHLYQSENVIGLIDIQMLCRTLMAIFKAISSIDQRFIFRNQIFHSRFNIQSEDDESTDLLFRSVDVWSQHNIMTYVTELRIACNRIVETQDSNTDDAHNRDVNDTIIDTLCWISVIMPYAVLSRLVEQCICHKGQATAVQRVLQNSGSLCYLQPSPNHITLLAQTLNSRDVITLLRKPENRRNYADSVCRWAKIDTAFNSISSSDGSSADLKVLLDVTEYFRVCLIPGLSRSAKFDQIYIEALPAFLNLLSRMLSSNLESDTEVRQLADRNNVRFDKYCNLEWLKDVNMIQLVTELATLISFRTKSLDGGGCLALSHLRFADWEACIFALEAVIDIIYYYEDEIVAKIKKVDKKEGTVDKEKEQEQSMRESFEILYEKYVAFDFDLQLKLYPLLSKMCRKLSVEEPYVAVPSYLVELLSGVDGVIASDTQQGEESNRWISLMIANKSSSYIHEAVVKNVSNTELYGSLNLHPYENVAFITGMYQALLPARSMSVLSEYKRLLIDFPAKIFELPKVPTLMRTYDYGNQLLNSMVNKLDIHDLRILHAVMYSKMLLQTYIPLTKSQSDAVKSQSPPSKDEHNHAVYFVASIMRVIQSLRNWPSILQIDNTKKMELERQHFSDYLQNSMPELRDLKKWDPAQSHSDKEVNEESANCSTLPVPPDDEFDLYIEMSTRQQRTQSAASGMQTDWRRKVHRELLFPPETSATTSSITLSVITLNLLSHIKAEFQDDKLQESIWIMMSKIVEGICSDPQRKRLIQAARKAGKASIKNWKKRTDDHKYIVRCRPLLDYEQQQLTQDTLDTLDSDQERQVIAQKLDLSGTTHAKAPPYYL